MKARLVLLIRVLAAITAMGISITAAVRPVNASLSQQEACSSLVWREKTSGSFVVLYTPIHVSLADQIQQNYARTLSEELVKYEQAFGIVLQKPITIRLYPTEVEYYCLNALAPPIGTEDLHSHIGAREIALMANLISLRPMVWETEAVNALRHELAILFGEQLSNAQAPPGLLQGLGGYFEDPAETFPERFGQARSPKSPDRGWQRLWEEDVPASNSLVLLQQTSIVAYLVDIYGWEKFVEFIKRIPEDQGYRQASQEVFSASLQELYQHWQRYYPVYVESRWQANTIYNFDLSQYEMLIAAGAYTDAKMQLEDNMPMIELFGDKARVLLAADLLRQASMGVEAGTLALESRQAILSGEYELGLAKAEESLGMYTELGDDRRMTELETYRNISFEILSLREELALLKGGAAPLDPLKTERLVEIGRRLSELGDAQGTEEVQFALLLLGVGQQEMVKWVTVFGLALCVIIIYRRFRFAQRNQLDVGDLL